MQALAMVWPILCCVQISECRPQDLDVLGAAMPSVSPRAHYLRFERQLAGQSTILIAWVDGVPAGHAEVRWDGNDVGDPFPHCPQVNAMEVWPPERRSQGIGTALIAAAERRALARGLGQLGLGVADTNRRAADLYLRLASVRRAAASSIITRSVTATGRGGSASRAGSWSRPSAEPLAARPPAAGAPGLARRPPGAYARDY
jgi:hypothetical protein